MSYSPSSGFVYIPTVEMPQYYSAKGIDPKTWSARPFFYNTGYDVIDVEGLSKVSLSASLLAWDPVTRRKAWEVPLPGLWNGGTLATAGNLVFQGNAGGEFVAYNATNGTMLWRFDAGLGINGAPISYLLDGKQYVAILVGWGGALPGSFGLGVRQHGWHYGQQPRRLLVFTLDAKRQLPVSPQRAAPVPLDNPELRIDEQQAAAGQQLFNSTCHLCHGFMAIAGGGAPDLRASPLALSAQAFRTVLKEGPLLPRGMPLYDDLTDAEIASLYAYIRQRARVDLEKENVPVTLPAGR